MIKLPRVALWLAIGHACVLGLFWGLVNVPESNVWMLAASACLAIATIVALGLVDAAAVRWLDSEATLRDAARYSVMGWIAVIPAAVVAGAFWWLGTMLISTVTLRAGEIDAWLIASFGLTRTAWLHATLRAAGYGLIYVVGVSLSVAAFAAVIRSGASAIASSDWIRRGLSLQALALTALSIGVLIWVPWQAVYWRPAWVPSSAIELAFVGAKLAAVFLVVNFGWACVLRAALAKDVPDTAV